MEGSRITYLRIPQRVLLGNTVISEEVCSNCHRVIKNGEIGTCPRCREALGGYSKILYWHKDSQYTREEFIELLASLGVSSEGI